MDCQFALHQLIMGRKAKKKKLKKHKYKAITFRLSERQNHSLMKYCKACNTTPIKVIKRNLEKYLGSYDYTVQPESYVSERQLDLFGDTGAE